MTAKVQLEYTSLMRKEVLIAVLIGLSLGLVVAFGVRTARQSLERRAKASPTPLTTTAGNTNQSNHSVLITAPEPDEIISTASISVIGTTTPQSMVSVITGSNVDVTTIADDTGAFNTPIELESGLNSINVVSYNPSGDNSNVSFTVIYSTADLTSTSSAKAKAVK